MTPTAKTATTVLFFLLLTFALCWAFLQTPATFVAGKFVATNHTTLMPYSEIQCAAKCFEEGHNNRCSVAGYSRNTRTCYLSLDSLQNVSDVADQKVGVFIMQGITFVIVFCSCDTHIISSLQRF